MRIYKYPVKDCDSDGRSYIELPEDAECLSIIIQNDEPYVYAKVKENNSKTIERQIVWVGTGWPIDKEIESKLNYFTFLGTVQDSHGCVWHFWIEPEKIKWDCINFETNEIYTKHCYKI